MPLPAAPRQELSPEGHEGLALLPMMGELCTGAALEARLLRDALHLPGPPPLHSYVLVSGSLFHKHYPQYISYTSDSIPLSASPRLQPTHVPKITREHPSVFGVRRSKGAR